MAKIGSRWAGLTLVAVGVVGAACSMPIARGQVPPVPGPFPKVTGNAPTRRNAAVYPASSSAADALLRNAAGHARDGQLAEAVDLYQRVIQQFGETVAKLPRDDPAGDPSGESDLWVDVRQYCQRRLAALPPEGRALYRARVDAQAEHWFRRGALEGDRSALLRVVELAFCSSWGDDALDLLGDMAFQEGRFAEALTNYRQLLPDTAGGALGLVYPDPSVDLARVAAKKLLCRTAIGDNPPTEADIQAFAAAYPKATGSLSGRNGPLIEGLRAALANDHLQLPAQIDGRWPTFAGAPSRTKVAPGPIDVGSFQWKVKLATPAPIANGNPAFPRRGMRGMGVGMAGTPPGPDQLLAYHPIVLNDQVVICNDDQIIAYNLNDRPSAASNGSIHVAWQHPDGTSASVAPARSAQSPARYTLTAFGDRIYARLGTNGPSMPYRMNGMMPVLSYIVAVQRSTEGKILWKRPYTDIDLPRRQGNANDANAGFEGTPVADARNVYAALTVGGPMTATYVVCLDAETGGTRWVRYICESSAQGVNNMMGMGFGMGMPFGDDLGNRLLSLDGATIYYQTNMGAVAALDAETGRIRWFASYPQKKDEGPKTTDRDLNPAIVHDGLVIVAPDDASSILAFDAATGRLVWKTPPLDEISHVTHLLGVAKGRLIATGNHVLSIDVKTGKLVRCWPDSKQGFEGFGRGLLAGEHIYWPTKTEIQILDQSTGLRSDRPPIKLREMFGTGGGNLAVGDGYLIVAQADTLVVFCQNSRLIERYRQEIAKAPDQAAHYFRLAQVAEATGDDELALVSLGQAIGKGRASEQIDGMPLVDAVRGHQYRLQMKLGSRAAERRDWAEAARRFESAASAGIADRERLTARLRLAEAEDERGDPAASVATLQGLLADTRLRPLTIAADGHRTVRADLAVTDRLETILRAEGRGLYDEFDRRAREMLDQGKREKDLRLLEEVGRSYPAAVVVPDALLALGQLSEALNRPADAAHAYKRLLAVAPDDSLRARAIWGLAESYKAQKLWVPARDAYVQARSRFADVKLEELGTDAPLGVLATDRLARPPFDRMSGDRSETNVPVPLVRRWSRRWDESVRPLAAEGVPPSAEASHLFLAEGTSLRPVDPISGESSWNTDLGGEPVWVGYLADRVIAATETKLLGLALDKGTIAWEYTIDSPSTARRGPNPFAKAEAAPAADAPSGRFHDFRIVGDRIFCRRGDRELLAFDGDAGLVDWSYTPPTGGLGAFALIGPRRIVLQVRKPNAILILETETGRRHAEFPQGDEDQEWAREPLPIDDDHVVLATDPRTVALFDLNRGVNAWTFRESDILSPNGPPRAFGDGERLLVLHNGSDLIRLDLKTGLKLWACPLGVENLSERPEALALDGDRVYFASGRTLAALSLSDGATIWRRHLNGPTIGWSIALTRRCVAAYPNPARSSGLDSLPLVFCRRNDGVLVQRFLFPVGATEVAVRLAPRGALVATDSGLWALGDRAAAIDEEKATR